MNQQEYDRVVMKHYTLISICNDYDHYNTCYYGNCDKCPIDIMTKIYEKAISDYNKEQCK